MAGFGIPKISIPNIPVPNIPVPDFKVPNIPVPNIPVPDFKVPNIPVPNIPVPDFKVPNIPVPNIPVPDFKVPNIPVPNIPVPDFKVPNIPVPNIPVPDFKVPNIPVPNIPVPDFKVPELPTTGYETNKFDLKSQVESGPPPWNVAWADDITEQDAMIGIVSVGVSIFAENPAPFYLWIENLINRTVSSLLKSGENFPNAIINQAKELAANGIRQAISGNNPIEVFQNYDTVDFKAGAIKYSGRNLLLGQTVSPTFGLKPYVAFRWRASGIPVYYY